jgi:hypothetical protein
MEREREIRQVKIVYTEIVTKLIDKTFRFSLGWKAVSTLSRFLNDLEGEYGTVTKERIVDFCVFAIYTYRESEMRTIQKVFGKKTLKRFREVSHRQTYYENRWLSGAQLTRGSLCALIADKREHPHAKYIYMESEEGTKKRLLNQESGYLICQISTLGWSPVSETCEQCVFCQECKKETGRKYPELYRIRLEYGK